MSEQDEQARIAHGQKVLQDADRESEHLRQVLDRSRRVRSQAIPILKRAGFLR